MNSEKYINYLKLLSKQYPNIDAVCTEIINLRAILSLPKGTEHFLTDLHGEYEAFTHVLRNASGVIKRKIDEAFGNTMTETEKKTFATLVYYPEQKIDIISSTGEDMNSWFKTSIYRLIILTRVASYKYTRSKVRKTLPKNFAYIIEELLHEKETLSSKQEYYNQIIESIIKVGKAEEFIYALCGVIRKLVVDRLHIVGDIFDRGPGAHIILDELMNHHSVDIQWGNHDIIWMGAALGSEACLANALRISLRYGNMETIEEGYGINLLPLATFAMENYPEVSDKFQPRKSADREWTEKETDLIKKMHKAIAMIQFKVEGQLIMRNPDFKMEHRLFLDTIDLEGKTVTIEGKVYELNETDFPTLDPENPYALTEDEQIVLDKLVKSFENSDKLQKHTDFLFRKGSIYLRFNDNLLYHAGMPINDDKSFKEFTLNNQTYSGKNLFDIVEAHARQAYYHKKDPVKKRFGLDLMWYLWNGECSPLFAKKKMTTFERYFIDDKSSHSEMANAYFSNRDDENLINRILEDFEMDPKSSNIISGHVPVKTLKGEHPVKAGDKMFVIDGGFSKAYHETTGIAGYTLTYNSRGMILVSHEPFESLQKAIYEEKDSIPNTVYIKENKKRIFVNDTDVGSELRSSIESLHLLLDAYRKGYIKEKR
ncbi:fructose-1,6-bisphosphatase [Acidaminobacter sp. JC074]|uniref:fructose-1,6-bisphosphatase n=1 Tax=Acidaminobacter sp. JC074 TaxID=2530199 RepID=UPI001F0F551F|nr:fructose-1,6-bisphosphatase [Acidaminobacter sp. JC074]MCH4890963.1 fructose-1,6-bisphosphatase [Acidaminobacter sp. JC074]